MPTVQEAVTEYETAGGNLTRRSYFGRDPLAGDNNKISRRERQFLNEIQPPRYIFGQLVNGNNIPFRHAVSNFIRVTMDAQMRE